MNTQITLTKTIDIKTLGQEIAVLGLPNYTGIAKRSRDIDANGRAILVKGKPVSVPPYLIIRADPLTGPEIALVRTAIAAHAIPQRPPTARETLVTEITAATTLADLKTALIKRFG